ncbi:protein BNIP5 [Phodopus roborovskii]|uniref:protein BNIP5 n=1 Tax=Phodopus roborovskii TaxID=109678 RepID=UPI0021E4B84A|nr:protein BNIP5 [Phodopus roborovskii]
MVQEPKEVQNSTFKVTSCYRITQSKTNVFEKSMIQFVGRQPVPAMPSNTGHNQPPQPEEGSARQSQQEEIQTVITQLRQIGDRVHRWVIQGVPRKDSESLNSKYPSGPTYKKVLRRTASDGARDSGSPSHFAEAQGAVAAALPLGEGSKLLPCEQGPPEDTKKEKPPKQTQQSWASMLLNIFSLRTGQEEPREKASRKSKGKGQTSKFPEAREEPGLRKKSQEKKTGRKKHGHRKPGAEEPTGPQSSEADGQEDTLPSLAASQSEEAGPGLICRERPGPEIPQALPTQEGHAESSQSSVQAAGPPLEEDPQKPDQDEVIWKIVELLKKAGDHLEEEVRRLHQRTPAELLQLRQVQVPQPEVAPQKPTPPPRKKSQEKKSNLKRVLSLKKPASEEPKRGGAATAFGPETRPKRPSYLPVCISAQRPSTSSSHDSEEPRFQEVLSVDGGCPHSSELHTPTECQGPAERPPRDRAWESREFRRKILALLRSAEEQNGEQQAEVQEAEDAGENPAPACKVKSQGKKSNLRRAFSLRKHGSKDSKRTEAASGTPGAASPETRPPKRHGFLPMCVSGHRASISSGPEDPEFQKLEAAGGEPAGSPEVPFQARSHAPDEQPLPEGAWESKESVIHKLVEGLQEVDSDLGRQIRQYPSFKKFFNGFSDASLRKLVAALDRQKARLSEEDRSPVNRPPLCAFGSLKFSVNHSCAICTLMQSSGHYKGHSYAHFLSSKAQQNITSLAGQSPD